MFKHHKFIALGFLVHCKAENKFPSNHSAAKAAALVVAL